MQRSCCKLPRSGSNMPVDASLHRFASVLTLLPFLPELESDPAFANYQETGNPFLPRFGEERYGVVRILPDRTSGTPQWYPAPASLPFGRHPGCEWSPRPELPQRRI